MGGKSKVLKLVAKAGPVGILLLTFSVDGCCRLSKGNGEDAELTYMDYHRWRLK
jgi:hypothetical protein